MFYVIEYTYVGPDPYSARWIDVDRIEIRTEPALSNLSREPCISGWCGTTNDYSTYAHGEFETLEDACAAVVAKFGPVRNEYVTGGLFLPSDETVVRVYKPGKYEPLGRDLVADSEGPTLDQVTAATSDETIAEWVQAGEAQANSDGYTYGDFFHELLIERRAELRKEAE